MIVKAPKDLGAGAIYVALGLAAVLIARGYTFGSGSEMGPGYFPTILGWILVALGTASIVRAFLRRGEPIGAPALRAAALVIGSTVLFGWLLLRAGLPVALVALALGAAAASRNFRPDVKAFAGLALLVVLCSAVFVVGLGLPMPLLGSWFGAD